jgi:hypothetical protein
VVQCANFAVERIKNFSKGVIVAFQINVVERKIILQGNMVSGGKFSDYGNQRKAAKRM